MAMREAILSQRRRIERRRTGPAASSRGCYDGKRTLVRPCGKDRDMYGGNDKRLDEIASEVKKTVIGQDDAVDWLCTFADAACARSRIVHEQGVDPLALPAIGSALIVGPTASGKSHLLKTFAKASGLLFQAIDATSITAAGYIGDSFGKQWVRASAALEENPDRTVPLRRRSGQNVRPGADARRLGPVRPAQTARRRHPRRQGRLARRQFLPPRLRPLHLRDGRRVHRHRRRHRLAPRHFPLDRRIRVGRAGRPFRIRPLRRRPAGARFLGRHRSLGHAARNGRPSFHGALPSRARRRRPARNHPPQQARRVRRMLPEGARFSIDAAAEDLLVENALEAHYGARSINQQINEVFFGAWRAMASMHPVAPVTLDGARRRARFRHRTGRSERRADTRAPVLRAGAPVGERGLGAFEQDAQLPDGARRRRRDRPACIAWNKRCGILRGAFGAKQLDRGRLRRIARGQRLRACGNRAAQRAAFASARLVSRRRPHAAGAENPSFHGRVRRQGEKPARRAVLSDRKRRAIHARHTTSTAWRREAGRGIRRISSASPTACAPPTRAASNRAKTPRWAITPNSRDSPSKRRNAPRTAWRSGFYKADKPSV